MIMYINKWNGKHHHELVIFLQVQILVNITVELVNLTSYLFIGLHILEG